MTTVGVLAMMLLAFLINLTAYPVSGGLLPYVAQRVYHVDATGLGWLVASFAFGGLLASGLLIERIGYPLTISALSAIGLALTALIGIRWRASLWP